MFTLPPAVRVYVAIQPVDLRKSFNGLSIAVADSLKHDPLSGHLYVFRNKRGNQLRVIFWDRTGYCIYGKKLARGTFRVVFDVPEDTGVIEVDAAELGLILEGIELIGAHRRKRWRAPEKNLSFFARDACL